MIIGHSGCFVWEKVMLRDYAFQELSDFDREVYQLVVPQEHFLNRAMAMLPWDEFADVLVPYYCVDQGRPALKPVQMLKLEYLRYQYNLSDREVIKRAETDLAFRQFLELPLRSPMPDASSLCVFRGRLGVEGFQKVFNRVVQAAREHGFVKDRLRIKDATHVIGNMAIPTALALVAQTRDKLLDAAQPFAEVMVIGEQVNLELLREATKKLVPPERLVTRLAQLCEMLVWVDQVEPPSDPDNDRLWQKFLNQRDLAHKILSDQEQPGSGDQTISTTDPDARRGKHGQFYNGYLVDLIVDADSSIITQLNVLPANGNEGFDAIELLQREQAAHGNQVQAISIDGAGYSGPLLRQLQDPTGLNVEAFVPVPAAEADEKFTLEDFTFNAKENTFTCPAGATSSSVSYSPEKQTTRYRFRAKGCCDCPLLDRCMNKPPVTVGRTVCRSDYLAEHQQAKQKTKTAAYQEIRREHPQVERKLGEMMNRHGGRRAKYFGKAKVLIQETMAGLATNVKRIVQLACASLEPQLTN
jgi:IS5 family transposase